MLYIKVENGQTVDHPVFSENLIDVFGEVPAGYEPFIRTEPPVLGRYEVWDEDAALYGPVEGAWTDLWSRRPMTSEERAAREVEILAELENVRQRIVEITTEGMALLTKPKDVAYCEAYLAELRALELSAGEDFVFPHAPLIVDDGTLILPATGPGSAPDIVG